MRLAEQDLAVLEPNDIVACRRWQNDHAATVKLAIELDDFTWQAALEIMQHHIDRVVVADEGINVRVIVAVLRRRQENLMDRGNSPSFVELHEALPPRIHHVERAIKEIHLVTVIVETIDQDFRPRQSGVRHTPIADDLPGIWFGVARLPRCRLEAKNLGPADRYAKEIAVGHAPPFLMIDDVQAFARGDDIVGAIGHRRSYEIALAASTTSKATQMRDPSTPLGSVPCGR